MKEPETFEFVVFYMIRGHAIELREVKERSFLLLLAQTTEIFQLGDQVVMFYHRILCSSAVLHCIRRSFQLVNQFIVLKDRLFQVVFVKISVFVV